MTKETPMEETKECKCVWVDDFLKDCTDCPIHTIRGSNKLPNKEGGDYRKPEEVLDSILVKNGVILPSDKTFESTEDVLINFGVYSPELEARLLRNLERRLEANDSAWKKELAIVTTKAKEDIIRDFIEKYAKSIGINLDK